MPKKNFIHIASKKLADKLNTKKKQKDSDDQSDGVESKICKENKNCLQLLVDNGADLWSKDFAGRTPLHWACSRGNYEVAEEILNLDNKKGVNVSYKVLVIF